MERITTVDPSYCHGWWERARLETQEYFRLLHKAASFLPTMDAAAKLEFYPGATQFLIFAAVQPFKALERTHP